ncbi:ECF transporter S component [Bacillaceae bacterium Marseille-Q3522]|nr:ECF transporter S component [Bacillaceae bacterium Marseille-Q3522]
MNLKKISLYSLFLALSVVGASIKIPAVVSSVALDMVPALLGGILLSSGAGALIAFLGHLLSAFIGGMPLGPFHFLLAIEMAFLVWLCALLYKKGKRVLAAFFFIFGNTIVAPLPFLFIISSAFYVGVLPSLFVGSTLNVVLSLLLAPHLSTFFTRHIHKETAK